MSSPNFINKSPMVGLTALRAGGKTPAGFYPELREHLLARAGREVANLFAEPVAGGDDSISWYAERSGEPLELRRLDAEAAQIPRARLRKLLSQLDPLLDDSVLQPMLRAALWVSSSESIVSVGGQPLLTGWGYLPDDVVSSIDAQRAHFAETIGRFAPFPVERLLPAQDKAAPSAVPPGGTSAPRPASVLTMRESRPAWPIGAPVALAIAVGLLVFLLIPGVLRYAEGSAAPNGLLEQQQQVNNALAEKIAALKAGLAGAQCLPGQGFVDPPGGAGPAATGPAATAPTPQLPAPDPKETKPPPSAAALPSIESLDAFLDAAVVLVLVPIEKDGQQGASQGSGFVIGPGLIVTNHHVVENSNGQPILVANHKLGKPVEATILAATEKTAPYPDFAVLKIDAPVQLPEFELSAKGNRLTDVLIVGYTGQLVERDLNFRRLLSGDLSAMPNMDVAPGIISVRQTLLPGVEAIVHTAAAATHGNSGGPMVDRCGRVLGVHTYGWDPQISKPEDAGGDGGEGADDKPLKINIDLFRYAEASTTLIEFLDAHQIPYHRNDAACDPQRVTEAAGPTGSVPKPTNPTPADPPPAKP